MNILYSGVGMCVCASERVENYGEFPLLDTQSRKTPRNENQIYRLLHMNIVMFAILLSLKGILHIPLYFVHVESIARSVRLSLFSSIAPTRFTIVFAMHFPICCYELDYIFCQLSFFEISSVLFVFHSHFLRVLFSFDIVTATHYTQSVQISWVVCAFKQCFRLKRFQSSFFQNRKSKLHSTR